MGQWTTVRPRYSQLSPCGYPAITDTLIKRTAAKSPAKTNYRGLTEKNSRYYGHSFMRTLTRGPYSVRNEESWLLYRAFWPLSSLHSKCIFLFNYVGKQQNTLTLCTWLFTHRINMRTDMYSVIFARRTFFVKYLDYHSKFCCISPLCSLVHLLKQQ